MDVKITVGSIHVQCIPGMFCKSRTEVFVVLVCGSCVHCLKALLVMPQPFLPWLNAPAESGILFLLALPALQSFSLHGTRDLFQRHSLHPGAMVVSNS